MRLTATSETYETYAQQLWADGLCLVPKVLNSEDIAELREIAHAARGSHTSQSFPRDSYSGLVTDVSDLPELSAMIARPGLYALLKAFGCKDPRWFMGFMIQKPPGGGPLYWHQDWWGWSHSISYKPAPPLVFLMLYLQDVDQANGCLRLLPGSHRTGHPLHEEAALSDFLAFSGGSGHPLLRDYPGEIDVPARAGDLLIRDARVLHATHRNRTLAWRALLLLSFVPAMALLPESIQRMVEIKRPKLEKIWPVEHWSRIAPRVATYRGSALPIDICRRPVAHAFMRHPMNGAH